MKIRKKYMKLSLFAKYVIVYMENLHDSRDIFVNEI